MRPGESRALVRGVNMVKRHQKQTAAQEGGIISKEAPIASLQSGARRSQGRQADAGRLQGAATDGRKVRVAKRSGVEIDG